MMVIFLIFYDTLTRIKWRLKYLNVNQNFTMATHLTNPYPFLPTPLPSYRDHLLHILAKYYGTALLGPLAAHSSFLFIK